MSNDINLSHRFGGKMKKGVPVERLQYRANFAARVLTPNPLQMGENATIMLLQYTINRLFVAFNWKRTSPWKGLLQKSEQVDNAHHSRHYTSPSPTYLQKHQQYNNDLCISSWGIILNEAWTIRKNIILPTIHKTSLFVVWPLRTCSYSFFKRIIVGQDSRPYDIARPCGQPSKLLQNVNDELPFAGVYSW